MRETYSEGLLHTEESAHSQNQRIENELGFLAQPEEAVDKVVESAATNSATFIATLVGLLTVFHWIR
ncbi:hypothetical protein Y032_0002g1046 [Ancylostoma ceylanicum]|uniref:Uncharacterized protein n=1 Tax=Ancylostoma ceylanicum TaxID=53326 RepID=A0A016VYM5_9BILA|nr:hypothetical protein Y032_0002g1046 [Ancylostoma ceylanicum]